MKAFGVGCFHFALKDNMEKEITVQEYMDEIKKSIQSLTSASEFKISAAEYGRDKKINTSAPNPKINDGEPCYPAIEFLNLSFVLYIPSRIQAELIRVPETVLDTRTERFKITMIHEWNGPVSYVECLSAEPHTHPSTAVQVVREYLTKEFSKIDTFLVYDLLGPSPFHADFYLQSQAPQEEKQTKFILNEIKSPAYNTLNFNYYNTDYPDEEKALHSLYDTISDELSFYYELNRESQHNFERWLEIQETTHTILLHEEQKKWRHLPKRLIEKPKLFKKVFKDIGLFKGHQIFAKGTMETNYASIYKNGKTEYYLKSYIDQEISERTQYPLNETSELISYFDQKNSRTFELITIVSAAILGGMTGSIITTAFGN